MSLRLCSIFCDLASKPICVTLLAGCVIGFSQGVKLVLFPETVQHSKEVGQSAAFCHSLGVSIGRLLGAHSRAGPKASKTGGLQPKTARTTGHKQTRQGSASSSGDAAASSMPAYSRHPSDDVIEQSLESSRTIEAECAAHNLMNGRDAAFGAAHAARRTQDAATSIGETVHSSPPSAKDVSGSSSFESVPQSFTQVPFCFTML